MSLIASVPRTVRLWSPGYPDPADIQLVEDERGWSFEAPSGWRIVESYSPLASWNLLQAWARKTGRRVEPVDGCAVIEVHDYEDGPVAARRVS